jgi:hypothetical protein
VKIRADWGGVPPSRDGGLGFVAARQSGDMDEANGFGGATAFELHQDAGADFKRKNWTHMGFPCAMFGLYNLWYSVKVMGKKREVEPSQVI